jgi:UDP-N-acetylmuramoyl-tripeptide--D-alanyl-D-alanine ligase
MTAARPRLFFWNMEISDLNLTLADITQAFGLALDPERDAPVTGVSIDSRTIRAGMVFFALSGPRFDGHGFVTAAFEKGAAAAVVEEGRSAEIEPSAGGLLIPVGDALRALQDLASLYRKQLAFPLIAVSGTNGKTTTKDMIAAVLRTKFRTAKTEGNLNNAIGVPLSLCACDNSHEAAVLEMGTNHPGEIRRLCEIARPTHGVLTNIGLAHLEFLRDLDGVAAEKSDLLRGLAEGGTAFLNGDDERLAAMKSIAPLTVTFGFGDGFDVAGRIVKTEPSGAVLFEVEDRKFRIPVPGTHNASNALAAVAIGKAFGVPWDSMQEALERFSPPEHRTRVTVIAGVRIIDDSYNANPSSVEQAVLMLKSMPSLRRRAVVLGDMLELGDRSGEEHGRIGGLVADVRPNAFFCTGEAMAAAADEARSRGMRNVFHFGSKPELSAALKGWVREGDGLLFKGSRGAAMEETVEALKDFLNVPSETGGR